MKVFMVMVVLAMGFFIYKQQQQITDLQTSLDTAKQSSGQLQKQVDDLKAAAAVSTPAPQPPPVAAATPTPTPSNWMWSKSSLDGPVPDKKK